MLPSSVWAPALQAEAAPSLILRLSLPADQELIKAGANVNAIVPNQGTALHAAAGCGQVATVSELAQSRAMVDATTSTGETPLHVAAHHGHRAVVTNLLQSVGPPFLLASPTKTWLLLLLLSEAIACTPPTSSATALLHIQGCAV